MRKLYHIGVRATSCRGILGSSWLGLSWGGVTGRVRVVMTRMPMSVTGTSRRSEGEREGRHPWRHEPDLRRIPPSLLMLASPNARTTTSKVDTHRGMRLTRSTRRIRHVDAESLQQITHVTHQIEDVVEGVWRSTTWLLLLLLLLLWCCIGLGRSLGGLGGLWLAGNIWFLH